MAEFLLGVIVGVFLTVWFFLYLLLRGPNK